MEAHPRWDGGLVVDDPGLDRQPRLGHEGRIVGDVEVLVDAMGEGQTGVLGRAGDGGGRENGEYQSGAFHVESSGDGGGLRETDHRSRYPEKPAAGAS